MGRLLQTQHKLYSLKIQNPRFSAQLWKARLQASVEKPDSLVAAAMQRLQETSISLRTGKSGFFLVGWKQQEHFSFVLLIFPQPIQTPPAPFILLPLECILPPLSNHYSTWLFPGWILPTVNLENFRLYLEQSSLPPDASRSGS